MLLFQIISVLAAPVDPQLRAGFGKADITGPIGEIDLMGYAKLGQQANGIHFRLQARAFIVGDQTNRVVFVNADAGQVSQFGRQQVIKLLNNPLYKLENVMISATHTHSGPAGYLDDFLYQANTFGKVQGEREAIAQGIVAAIQKAHADFEQNQGILIDVHEGKVFNASRNRSPTSYLANPESERAKYDGDTDKTMTLVSFTDKTTNKLKATFNWFAVHGTSMMENFEYVSGDNKGYASYAWELEQKLQGNQDFMAAFAISNAGDVTPNIFAPVCNDTGLPCDGSKTSCPDGKGNFFISKCYALGPGGEDGFKSTKVIGSTQLDAAKNIAAQPPVVSITGPVEYRHAFVDMSNVQLNIDGKTVSTCKPAMGQSFAAGTTDGPGIDLAYQGVGPTNPGLNILGHLAGILLTPLPKPSNALEKCQAPKSILLATGEFKVPYQWQSSVVPLQLFVLGRKFVIIGQPSEITTMAGRRLREAVLNQLLKDGRVDSDCRIVIAGLSNTYTSYVTTYEEYQMQRYEAGSTIFGPHTLNGYIDRFVKLASSFTTANTLPTADPVQEGAYSEFTLNNDLIHRIIFDAAPWGKSLGSVAVQPQVRVGLGETVTSTFYCAHPRNFKTFRSYMAIEQFVDGKWTVFLDDASWDTKFFWRRTGGALSPTSECDLTWSVNETVPTQPGTYRFHVYGTEKRLDGKFYDFDGVSNSFVVSN
ncbi:Neutral/alkaline nonlysosomal ceramidase [Gorgonomyces haynaldii]|nr:Neutral/alkaline nonlysosomal ceramidase [Gorgonomyces haynaldii]